MRLPALIDRVPAETGNRSLEVLALDRVKELGAVAKITQRLMPNSRCAATSSGHTSA